MNKQRLKKHALMLCFAALSPTFAARGAASSAPLCTSPVSPQLRASAKSEMDWRLPSGYHVLEINFPKAHLAIATPFENLATAQKHVPAFQILAIWENALIKRHCAYESASIQFFSSRGNGLFTEVTGFTQST
jgi:hypothetical protein